MSFFFFFLDSHAHFISGRQKKRNPMKRGVNREKSVNTNDESKMRHRKKNNKKKKTTKTKHERWAHEIGVDGSFFLFFLFFFFEERDFPRFPLFGTFFFVFFRLLIVICRHRWHNVVCSSTGRRRTADSLRRPVTLAVKKKVKIKKPSKNPVTQK